MEEKINNKRIFSYVPSIIAKIILESELKDEDVFFKKNRNNMMSTKTLLPFILLSALSTPLNILDIMKNILSIFSLLMSNIKRKNIILTSLNLIPSMIMCPPTTSVTVLSKPD